MKIKNPVFPWVQKVPMGSHVTFNEKKIFLGIFWWFFHFWTIFDDFSHFYAFLIFGVWTCVVPCNIQWYFFIFGQIFIIVSFLDRFWWSFNFWCPSTCSMMILNFWADYNNFSNFWVDFDDFFHFWADFNYFYAKFGPFGQWTVTRLRRLHCSNAIWNFSYKEWQRQFIERI